MEVRLYVWTVGQTGKNYICCQTKTDPGVWTGRKFIAAFWLLSFSSPSLSLIKLPIKIGNFSSMNNLQLQFLIFYSHLFKHCSYINDNQ